MVIITIWIYKFYYYRSGNYYFSSTIVLYLLENASYSLELQFEDDHC